MKTIASPDFHVGDILKKLRKHYDYDTGRLSRILRNRIEESKRNLSSSGPWFPGTAVIVKRKCRNTGCVCHRNPEQLHRAMYVTWKEKGKTVSIYIPKKFEGDVKKRIETYVLFRNSIKLLKLKMSLDMFKLIGIASTYRVRANF